MIVVEQVARRTMWCPEARIGWIGATYPMNRSQMTVKGRMKMWVQRTLFPRWFHWSKGYANKCYGTGCMMWRWHDEGARTGFCGLAGHPRNQLRSQEGVSV